jgi:hypothetical protein
LIDKGDFLIVEQDDEGYEGVPAYFTEHKLKEIL